MSPCRRRQRSCSGIAQLSTERGDGLEPRMLGRLERLRDSRPRTEADAVAELGHTLWLRPGDGAYASCGRSRPCKDRGAPSGCGIIGTRRPMVTGKTRSSSYQRNLITGEIFFAVWRALWCAREYERTREPKHLVRAIGMLGAAIEAERAALSPRLLPETYEAEARCLLAAVSDVLPRFECDFLIGFVTARIEEALKSRRRMQGDEGSGRGMTWLSMRFQVAVQSVDRPSKGHWFATELQDWYAGRFNELRQVDEIAAQKKAEEDKRMAEWTARREKEHLEEEAKAEQERQLAERTAAQTAMRAQRAAGRSTTAGPICVARPDISGQFRTLPDTLA